MFNDLLIGGVLATLAAIISFATLKYFSLPAPYVWILLTWAAVFACGVRLVPRASRIWGSLAGLACVLALLEGSLWISDWWTMRDIKSEGTFAWKHDDLLGFVAPSDTARTDRKNYRGRTLFDVVFTIDANGLRISSSEPQPAGMPCVLFFGDGYTFGWGLNDADTLPYRVARLAGGGHRVYNLAFLTHGAHQMLAEMEHGLVSKQVDCRPDEIRFVIYSATPDQVLKSAGLREMDLNHGPRYVMGADGTLSYQGQIGDNRSNLDKIKSLLERSLLFRKLRGGDAFYLRAGNDDDLELYLAIVDRARALTHSLYPNSDFHVLLWSNDALGTDKDGKLRKQMLDGLRNKGIQVHRVAEILPGSAESKPEYFLGEFSPHPTPLANERLASYIVKNILNEPDHGESSSQ